VSINGIQYAVTQNIDVLLPTLAANNLYFVYAILSGSSLTLSISQNVNSQGPGTTTWRLVGAFYANGNTTVGFGSFVTIDGVPTSADIYFIPQLQCSNGGNITLNSTNVINPQGFWKRIGSMMHYYSVFRNGTAGSATGSGGGVMIGVPTNLEIAGGQASLSDGNFGQYIGDTGWYQSVTGSQSYPAYIVYNNFFITPIKGGSGSVVNLTDLTAQTSINTKCTFKVNGWLDTPLKDL